MIKLTFIGDILSYECQDKLSKKGGAYDYLPYFCNIKSLLSASDYVVGSFETTCAGYKAGYTHSDMVFNTPDEIAYALKEVGVDMLTTANNHVLDRGVSGLVRTMDVLENNGLEFTGTRRNVEEKNYLTKEIEGVKFAFVAYTYGTNSDLNGCMLDIKDEFLVNLTRKQDSYRPQKWYKKIMRTCYEMMPETLQRLIRKPKTKKSIVDCVNDNEIANVSNERFVCHMEETIRLAKNESDIVVFCLHAGGQFNNEVGKYTKWLIERALQSGADVVVTNHPHTTLPIEYRKDGKLVAYALGNFSFTPRRGYYVDGVLADYSIALHLYVDCQKKVLDHFKISVLKVEINEHGYSTVTVVSDSDENVETILNRVNTTRDNMEK